MTFRGKACLSFGPVTIPDWRLIDRFDKICAYDAASGKVVGRVDLNKGALGRTLYPLYLTLEDETQIAGAPQKLRTCTACACALTGVLPECGTVRTCVDSQVPVTGSRQACWVLVAQCSQYVSR